MDSLFSKLSLYDLLAMVIPGGVLLYICTICTGIHLPCDVSAVGWVGIATLSYLLGLINHQLTAWIWRPFRNNTAMLTKSHRTFLKRDKQKSNESEKSKTSCPYCPAIVYLIMLLVVIGISCIWNHLCICRCIVWFLIAFALIIASFILSCRWRVEDKICDTYYKAYYKVIQHKYNNDIPIMEGQVAFMQSLLLPLVLITPVVANDSNLQWSCPSIRTLVMGIFIFSVILTIYARQMKIYNRVWEDDKYLKNEKNN